MVRASTNTPVSEEKAANLLRLASSASMLVAMILIVAKALAWMMTGSVSVLASLVDSIMDSVASLINFIAIRYSLEPADKEHPFGHGKAEFLAGLGQSIFIAISAVFLFVHAVDRILEPVAVESTSVGLAVMVFSIILTIVLLLIQKYVVQKTQSTAIEADSLHYVTDLLVNFSIIISLLLSNLGWSAADGWFALFIAGYILYSAWQIGNESVQLLLDKELGPEVTALIEAAVSEHPQIMGIHELRTRQSGRTQFIQFHLEMDATMSLALAHELSEKIEQRILDSFPNADVIIHQDPVEICPVDK